MSFSTVTAMMLGVVSTGMGEGELKAPAARRLYGFGTLVNEQGEPSYSPPSFFSHKRYSNYGGEGQPCYSDGTCDYDCRAVTQWSHMPLNAFSVPSCTCEGVYYGRLGASPEASGAPAKQAPSPEASGTPAKQAPEDPKTTWCTLLSAEATQFIPACGGKQATPSDWCPKLPESWRPYIPECKALEPNGSATTTQAPPVTTTQKPDDKKKADNGRLGGSYYGYGGYNQACYSDKTCNPGLIAKTEWVHMPANALSVPTCMCTAGWRLGAADAAKPTHAAADTKPASMPKPTHAAADTKPASKPAGAVARKPADSDSNEEDDHSWCNMLPASVKKMIPACGGQKEDSNDDSKDDSKNHVDQSKDHSSNNQGSNKNHGSNNQGSNKNHGSNNQGSNKNHADSDSNEDNDSDSNEDKPKTGKLGTTWAHMPYNAFSVPVNDDSYDSFEDDWAPAPQRSSCGGDGQRCCNWGSQCEYGLTANTQWLHMPANALSVPRCTCGY